MVKGGGIVISMLLSQERSEQWWNSLWEDGRGELVEERGDGKEKEKNNLVRVELFFLSMILLTSLQCHENWISTCFQADCCDSTETHGNSIEPQCDCHRQFQSLSLSLSSQVREIEREKRKSKSSYAAAAPGPRSRTSRPESFLLSTYPSIHS